MAAVSRFVYLLYDVVCEPVQPRLWNAVAQDWLTILSAKHFTAVICSTCRHAVGISECILLSGCARSGSGLNFHNLELRI